MNPVRLTVKLVLVAAVMLPVTPSLKATLSLVAFVSKAEPLIVRVVAVTGNSAVLGVIVSSSKRRCRGWSRAG